MKKFFAIAFFCAAAILSAEKKVFPVVGLVTANSTPAELEIDWDEKWFGRETSHKYDHDIARISAILSSNAYSKVENALKDGTLEKNPLRNAYKVLGVNDEDIFYDYDIDYENPIYAHDQAAYSIASKTIDSAIGKKTLIFLTVRGTTFTFEEWNSNVNIADSKKDYSFIHEGFLKCAAKITSSFEHYIIEKGINPKDSFLLLSGHSRGASIINLISAQIADDGIFDTSKVYSFPIGCPKVINDIDNKVDTKSEKYSFIWNISNEEDIVTSIPLAFGTWNYKRYGNNIVIPCRWNTENYDDEYVPEMNGIYTTIMNRKFEPFRSGSFIPSQIVRGICTLCPTTDKFYNAIFKPRKKTEKMMHRIFYNANENAGDVTKFGALPKRTGDMEREKLEHLLFLFIDMHTPEAYLSWMLSFDAEKLYKDLESNVLAIKGSSSVAVLDENGKVILKADDGKINYDSIEPPTFAFNTANMMYIGLPSTENFSVILQKKTTLPTPVTITLEKYDGNGVFEENVASKKIWLRNGSSKRFSAGKISLEKKAESIECTAEEEFAPLRRSLEFYFSGELNLSLKKEFQFGLHAGVRAIYGTLLVTMNDKNAHTDTDAEVEIGIGSMKNIFSRFYIDPEILWNIRAKSPSARVALSYQPRKRTHIFVAGNFDFNFDDGFDVDPTVQFGVKF
ncbi:MAG: hypothetical protein IKO57_07780 [Treponema sp.]|nr:hypothetical protein [Treponema sp.]